MYIYDTFKPKFTLFLFQVSHSQLNLIKEESEIGEYIQETTVFGFWKKKPSGKSTITNYYPSNLPGVNKNK